MIHSLSGGVIQDITYHNFAKVLLDNGELRYYTYTIPLKVGDKVEVPVGHLAQTGIVQKLMPNLSSREAPISPKRVQEIIKKL